MVLSETQDAASWYIGEAEPSAAEVPGLGLIPFQIYPHYDERILPEMKVHIKSNLEYVLLKNGQAISINDEEISFVGGDVTVIKPQ